nr:glutaredoxin-C1-like [Ipomoea batatas]
MCHAVKRLFCGMGVNPRCTSWIRTPKEGDGEGAVQAAGELAAGSVVFIGGNLVGTMTESWPHTSTLWSLSSRKPELSGFNIYHHIRSQTKTPSTNIAKDCEQIKAGIQVQHPAYTTCIVFGSGKDSMSGDRGAENRDSHRRETCLMIQGIL